MFSAAFAQDQLTTIYNEKNRFHDELLEEYYQDLEVKKLLANYNHQIVEATTERGKELIEKYNIKIYYPFPYVHILDTEQGGVNRPIPC